MLYRKMVLFTLTFIFAFGMLSCAAAEKNTGDFRPSVTVRGSAKLEFAPDCAYITFGVTNFNVDLNTAQSENNSKAAAVQKSLLDSGIDKKLIKTAYFNVQPVYKDGDREKFRGYQVSNEVRVRVDNLLILGNVINNAIAAGANDVSSLNFSLKDESEAKLEVLKLATREALRKANALADAANKNVIRVLTINEEGADFSQLGYRNYAVAMKSGNSMDGAAAPIQAGELTVTAEVILSCEID